MGLQKQVAARRLDAYALKSGCVARQLMQGHSGEKRVVAVVEGELLGEILSNDVQRMIKLKRIPQVILAYATAGEVGDLRNLSMDGCARKSLYISVVVAVQMSDDDILSSGASIDELQKPPGVAAEKSPASFTLPGGCSDDKVIAWVGAAAAAYAGDVRSQVFPAEEHTFKRRS
ncbi:Hypothetical protein NGAL_HAMBI2566_47580 [Neorhizobium galegae bv. orientalis]|nr:Hypothetical protein NGAL_HAMBI2566_47580 [Neorhizobium galegae bv. orientalis]